MTWSTTWWVRYGCRCNRPVVGTLSLFVRCCPSACYFWLTGEFTLSNMPALPKIFTLSDICSPSIFALFNILALSHIYLILLIDSCT